jgi:hypothetical protein
MLLVKKIISSITFSFFLLLFSWVATAQVTLLPLAQYVQLSGKAQARTENYDCTKDSTKINLPFFDDFTKLRYANVVDTTKWLCGSGVYVNNTLPIRPLSFNVASFDGIAANGQPYNFDSPLLVGEADVLTSKQIDLSKADSFPNLLLTFYLQPQGNGERPDVGDFFRVQLRDAAGNWNTVRQYEIRTNWIDFEYQAISITDPIYFHRNFQFRFQVVTRLSGAYDVWNLDYVYLDRNRTNTQDFADFAVGVPPIKVLKDYKAMPITHFNSVPLRVVDTIFAGVNYLRTDGDRNVLQYKIMVKDGLTNDTFATAKDSTVLVPVNARQFLIQGYTQKLKVPTNRRAMWLQAEVQMNTNERFSRYGFSTTSNDTFATTHVLDDYYAYDDGSAEYGLAFNQRFGKLAYEYNVVKEDYLIAIDVLFVPLGTNLKGETFNLYVWKNINLGGGANKDSLLLQTNVPLEYPTEPNKPQRIILPRNVLVNGKFYIGVEQLTDKALTLGFDKNNDNGSKIYYNIFNKWEQNTLPNVKGSIVMRPVFRKPDITGFEDNVVELDVNLYPNPTQDEVYIEGEVQTVRVMDYLGREVISQEFELWASDKKLTMNNLPNGVYIVQLWGKDHKKAVRKIVVQK